MTILVLGLIIFLGVHSTRIVANDWRTTQLSRWGVGHWKIFYSVISLVGLITIIWGYGLARQNPIVLWTPPIGLRHFAMLLNMIAMILFVAVYVPQNSIKARVHHPLMLSVKTWSFAHLMANGTLADIVVFGSFLTWAVAAFIAARKRDRAEGIQYGAGTASATITTIILGVVLWALITFWLHRLVIGVQPM